MSSIGLYIHIPFCKNKCSYCDFYSFSADKAAYDDYVIALKEKIIYWSNKTNKNVATVYFGGGTPSILGAKRLSDILNCIKRYFNVLENAEITAEINPESGKKLDYEFMKSSGFNRISIGLQTAVPSELKELSRIHSVDDVKENVLLAKKAGIDNISLDLMMGIPNQTIDSLNKSIDFCAECEVQHISSYILKIEKNTQFYKIQNELNLANEDLQAEMYLNAIDKLSELGYKQYEISNFALNGYESRHNINYWNCGEYIGIGPSAHSFLDGKRFYYERSMQNFIADKTVFDCLGGDEEEFIMLKLRLAGGIKFAEFKDRFGKEFSKNIICKITQFKNAGYIEADDEHFNLTPKGFLVSNAIISELI